MNGLAGSTAVGVGLLLVASGLDGTAQGAVWALALSLDCAGPYFFGQEGWKLVPSHFAERHGLILIIAIGESIVAIARDSYSYLHFPMVAGIVLFALGMKKTLGDTGDPLKLVPAVAMLGGASMYLLAHVAFRLRNIRTLNRPRLVSSVLVLCLIPLATEIPALATLGILSAGALALVGYEAIRYAEPRDRIRHELAGGATP